MAWYDKRSGEWPCKPDCPKRHPGCHDRCLDYAAAKDKNEAKKADIRAKRDAEHAINDHIARVKRRIAIARETGKRR